MSKIKTFFSRRWAKVTTFSLFMANYMLLQAPTMVSAASDLSNISNSLNKAEDPTMALIKTLGKFATLICIAGGGLYQYLGREFSEKGKRIWLTSVLATGVIWNAQPLRDFVINLF